MREEPLPTDTPTPHRLVQAEFQAVIRSEATMTMSVTRGPESWQYIYTTLGFALAIGAGVIQFLEPLRWYWKLGCFVAFTAACWHLFLHNGWFQNKLIGWKGRYEGKGR